MNSIFPKVKENIAIMILLVTYSKNFSIPNAKSKVQALFH